MLIYFAYNKVPFSFLKSCKCNESMYYNICNSLLEAMLPYCIIFPLDSLEKSVSISTSISISEQSLLWMIWISLNLSDFNIHAYRSISTRASIRRAQGRLAYQYCTSFCDGLRTPTFLFDSCCSPMKVTYCFFRESDRFDLYQ